MMGLLRAVPPRPFDFDGPPFGDRGPLAFQVLRGAVILLRPGRDW